MSDEWAMSDMCLICNKPVDDYEPIMCCTGSFIECGCFGQPTNPCICSDKCEDALFENIGLTMDERRKKAGIKLYE